MKKTLEEFKKFAMKGNAVELAVGFVIGAAFGKIVSSLVADIINPLIGILTGGIDLSQKVIVLKAASGDVAAVTVNYGSFITSVIDFVIIAFAIFMVIKQINKLNKKEEKSPKEDTKPSNEEVLLTEIRDSLRNR